MLTSIIFSTFYQGVQHPVVMECNHPLKRAAERGARYLSASGHTNIRVHAWKALDPKTGLTSQLTDGGAVIVLSPKGECVQYMFPPLNADFLTMHGLVMLDRMGAAKPLLNGSAEIEMEDGEGAE